jgi:ribosomal protein L40E
MNTFWVIVAVVVVMLVVTALQHRRHAAETANRLCRACGEGHPPHARFCRRCGTAMVE